eukprot:TRINITY_DN6785_c0_g1_i1.p1 TRINITY_DN6785_c0_g1~~TRINITY_DN6785_c0_g1_i1.p1  ORF type:complete len:152 (+),score=57.04 TRINITY_DN6785_c0_g1_i1:318-773(+)
MRSSLMKIWGGVKRDAGYVELSCRHKAKNVYSMIRDIPDDDAVPEEKRKDWERLQKKEEKEKEKRRSKKRKRDSSSESNISSSDASNSYESPSDSDKEYSKKKKKKRSKRERQHAKKKEEKKRKEREELIHSAVTQVSMQFGMLPTPVNHF